MFIMSRVNSGDLLAHKANNTNLRGAILVLELRSRHLYIVSEPIHFKKCCPDFGKKPPSSANQNKESLAQQVSTSPQNLMNQLNFKALHVYGIKFRTRDIFVAVKILSSKAVLRSR